MRRKADLTSALARKLPGLRLINMAIASIIDEYLTAEKMSLIKSFIEEPLGDDKLVIRRKLPDFFGTTPKGFN